MARAADQFRQSDVTAWALVALCCGAFAVLAANVGARVPPQVFAALHASRADGATLNQLHGELISQQAAIAQLRQENATMSARFSLAEQRGSETSRRVGALEVSIPDLLEILPDNAPIDRSNLTASIGAAAESGDAPEQFDVFGGTMSVQRGPMMPQAAVLVAGDGSLQPMPPVPEPLAEPEPEADAPAGEEEAALEVPAAPDAEDDGTALLAALQLETIEELEAAQAVALGPDVARGDADAAWTDIAAKVGMLLIGLEPRFDGEGEAGRLVVGPLASPNAASALCQRLLPVGITCDPVPYRGERLGGAAEAG
ncbi:hypothetical protein EMQ25_06845 [Arsenicitalea aurantiaca]|uniref:SPOR domain-containing protein n=1 Tax=Arsenicitalea aurantiaca TaxID=1783274 RepID=A0A433XFH2_9HYPH|nr:hypothetical protein [Arsenicitalea aurantiaca]RUT32849.1 hypothetical protein EMQ25_06845 [Arsenicitalea aurantiaca]